MQLHERATFDPSEVDIDGLMAELKQLRKEIRYDVGPEDIDHLKKMDRWGKICTTIGFATAPLAPNPLSSFLISQGIVARWLVAHHVSHGGYDKVPGIPEKYTSKVFGKGWRRLVDWMDWIHPEAWHEEHDFLHHYNLGEEADPDLVERNAKWMRDLGLPMWQRKALVGLLSVTWKWFYYAPNTYDVLQQAKARRAGKDELAPVEMLSPLNARGREVWRKALLPHFAWRFVAIPAAFLPLGPLASANVLLNSIGAELMTNLHAFMIIGPNHAGEDLYRFEEPAGTPREFYLRQIVGSANFHTGNDVIDFLHAWLNYQIEHHLWPDLTMLQYRKLQPKVKALCEEYGVPYVQESVFERTKKMIRVTVGEAKMIAVDRLTPLKRARPTRAAAAE